MSSRTKVSSFVLGVVVVLAPLAWADEPPIGPPGGCAASRSLQVEPGPTRDVLLGTEVHLDARILEYSIAKDCSGYVEDVTDSFAVEAVEWRFDGGRGHVGSLVDEYGLTPHFRADALGPYWLEVVVTSSGGEELSNAVLINARDTLVDLYVRAIEVTQVVQTEEGVLFNMTSDEVPMVARKDTLVRIYPGISGPGILSEADVAGALTVTRLEDGVTLTPMALTLGQRVVVEPLSIGAMRSSLSRSINFLIPGGSARGTVTLRAEINPSCRVRELGCENNTKELEVEFVPKRPFQLYGVAIRYRGAGLDIPPAGWKELSASSDFVKRMFPVSGIELDYMAEMVVTRSLESSSDWACDPSFSVGGIWRWVSDNCLLEDIEDFTGCGNWDCPGDWGSDPHFYGLVPLGTPTCDSSGCVYGMAQRDVAGDPEPTGAGLVDCPTTASATVCQKSAGLEFGGAVMAHELAHNYGRKHVNSGAGEKDTDGYYEPDASAGAIGEWAYDTGKRRLFSPVAFDIMTYQWDGPGDGMGGILPSPVGQWIGPYTYRGLYKRFPETLDITTDPPPGPSEGQEMLLVAGIISPDRTGKFRPMFQLSRTAPPTVPPGGPYGIELWDEPNNRLLNRVTFEPTPTGDGAEGSSPFRAYVAWDPATTAVVLKLANQVLHRVVRTPSKPSVAILEPTVGEFGGRLAEEVTVRWSAVDRDGDALWAKVQVSADGGATWRSFAPYVFGTNEVTFGTTAMAGTTRAYIRVFVTDGINTGFDTVGPFSVPFKNPTVTVVPPESAEYTVGEPVTAQAYAFDPEDGGIVGSHVWWESDLDGLLGFGTELATNQLSVGLHTLTVHATDSEGNVGSHQLAVRMQPRLPEIVQAPVLVRALNKAGNAIVAPVKLAGPAHSVGGPSPLSAAFRVPAALTAAAAATVDVGGQLLAFRAWTIDGQQVGTASELELALERETELVAHYAPACVVALAPAAQQFGVAGGAGTVSVTVAPGCAWQATSDATWLVVTAGASGTGNGTVSFKVHPTGSYAPRSALITVGGTSFTVTQDALTCTFVIAPSALSLSAAATRASVTVYAPTVCEWGATSHADWITIYAGSSWTGNGPLVIDVAANPAGSPRTGTVAVSGVTLTVTQAGAPAPCPYVISPTGQRFGAAGGTGKVAVTAGAGCAWTAQSSAPWLTVTAGSSGSGGGTVWFKVAANAATTQRSTQLVIGGSTFVVTQDGAALPCTVALAPTGQHFGPAGGVGKFGVTAPDACAWRASSSAAWLVVTAGWTGSGSGGVAFKAAPMSSLVPRSATISVGGATFVVTQDGSTCAVTVAPTSLAIAASGRKVVIDVWAAAGCAWSASSGAGWIAVIGGASGSGNGQVLVYVTANGTGAPRSGWLTVAGQTVKVSQGGP